MCDNNVEFHRYQGGTIMKYDVIVIGGGAAGMSAGLESAKNGAKTLIIERNPFLGGLLNQSVHNGLGLHYFKEELTGTEYANKFIKLVKKQRKLKVMLKTLVTKIDGKRVEIETRRGKKVLECKALVLAMGGKENTASSRAGLVPETDLINMPINSETKSIFVNDYLESENAGVFACGNFLHIHDIVDNVSLEAMTAGINASDYALNKLVKRGRYKLTHSKDISYIVPNFVHNGNGIVDVKFRVKKKIGKCNFVLKDADGEVVEKKFMAECLPEEMQSIEVDRGHISSDMCLEIEKL